MKFSIITPGNSIYHCSDRGPLIDPVTSNAKIDALTSCSCQPKMLANIMEGFLFGHGPTIVQYHVPFFIVSSWIPASIASTNFCEDSIVSGFRVEDDLIVMVWLCLQFYAGRRCSTGFAESEPNYMGRKVVLCYLWINLAWNMGVIDLRTNNKKSNNLFYHLHKIRFVRDICI